MGSGAEHARWRLTRTETGYLEQDRRCLEAISGRKRDVLMYEAIVAEAPGHVCRSG